MLQGWAISLSGLVLLFLNVFCFWLKGGEVLELQLIGRSSVESVK